MALGLYYENKKDSLWKYYSDKGILTSDEFYRRGEKNGLSSTYFSNGNASEQTGWVMGVKEGIWKQYFENGTLKTEGVHVNGELEGAIKYYYDNGNISHQGRYKNSLRDSTWVFYDDNGEIKLKKIYDNGKLLNSDELEEFLIVPDTVKIPDK